MVVPRKPSGADRAGRRAITGKKYARVEAGCNDALRGGGGRAEAEAAAKIYSFTDERRGQKCRGVDQVQLPTPGLGAPSNHRKIYPGYEPGHCLLITSDKEEGHVVAIEEEPVAGANHRLAVR